MMCRKDEGKILALATLRPYPYMAPPPDLQVSEKLPKHRKNTALKLRKGAVYWRYQYVRKSTFIHLYIHMLYHTLICHLHTFIIHISNQVSYIYHQYRLYQLFI
jgi:hypothetical protein